jgi:hypothetical protein
VKKIAADDPKRKLTKGVPEGWRAHRGCAHFHPKPYKPCLRLGEWLLVVQVDSNDKRKPYETRFLFCDEHAPEIKDGGDPSVPPEPDMVGTQEAADILGIPIMTLHKWRGRHQGPSSLKIKGYCWYRKADLEAHALSTVSPFQEHALRAKIAKEIEAEYQRQAANGLAVGPLMLAADIARRGQ